MNRNKAFRPLKTNELTMVTQFMEREKNDCISFLWSHPDVGERVARGLRFGEELVRVCRGREEGAADHIDIYMDCVCRSRATGLRRTFEVIVFDEM